jgi:uncharacterized protein involved in cysteine biosynthesis
VTSKLPITAPLPTGWRGVVSGAAAFMAGFKLVAPGGGMFRHAIAPVLLSILILSAITFGAFFAVKAWLEPWLAEMEWAVWISWLGGALAFVLALVVSYFLVEPVMTLLGPLFIDPVCEKTHVRYTGHELIGRRSAQAFIRRQMFAVVQSIQWTAVSLFVELPLALIGLLTFVGVALTGAISSMLRGLDLMDYPHSCRQLKLREKLAWARRYPGAVLGLGGAASVCKLIPVLNLFATVAGAAGATMLMVAADTAKTSPAQTP